MSYFEKVKNYVLELGHDITTENTEDSLLVINEVDKGICNMILDCEDDVLVIEQVIFPVKNDSPENFKRLLQINRQLVHGAFVLNEEGNMVIYRDTLQLENLDLNEIEASLNSLALGLVENMDTILDLAR